MKERPILFSGEMVLAILAGRKTQTRRLVKDEVVEGATARGCPYGTVGDRLWVKETFSVGAFGDDGRVVYRADIPDGKNPSGLDWKPSIFCSRKASRITLEITAVRIEKLQDIGAADSIAEGVTIKPDAGIAEIIAMGETSAAQFEYYALWCAINGRKSWDENPWVWVIKFKRV